MPRPGRDVDQGGSRHGPATGRRGCGAVWAAGAGGLVRIDVNNNSVDQRVSGCVISLVSAFGSVWAGVTGGMLRVDPRTGLAVQEIRPDTAAGLLCKVSAADDSVWLGCGKELSRIDPSSNSVRATVTDRRHQSERHCRRRCGVGARRTGSVWGGVARGRVYHVPASGSRDEPSCPGHEEAPRAWSLGRWAAGRWACRLAIDKLWGGSRRRNAARLRARIGKVLAAFDISEGRGYGSNAIAFGYGSLWTASGTANAVRRFPRPIP